MVKSLYRDLYLSPRFAIERMNLLRAKYGKQSFTKPELKEEREAAITALFLLGYRSFDKNEFWIGICQDDPPDTEIVSPQKRVGAKGLVKVYRKIEVFEWESHSSETLTQAISRKLEMKKYPEDYWLLCRIRRPGALVNIAECFETLQREKPGLSEIWLVSSISDGPFDQCVYRVYPSLLEKRFSLSTELLAIKNQTPILREGGRGYMNSPVPTYPTFLPLP